MNRLEVNKWYWSVKWEKKIIFNDITRVVGVNGDLVSIYRFSVCDDDEEEEIIKATSIHNSDVDLIEAMKLGSISVCIWLNRKEKTILWRNFRVFSNQSKCFDCRKRRKVKFIDWYFDSYTDEFGKEIWLGYCYSCFMDRDWEKVEDNERKV